MLRRGAVAASTKGDYNNLTRFLRSDAVRVASLNKRNVETAVNTNSADRFPAASATFWRVSCSQPRATATDEDSNACGGPGDLGKIRETRARCDFFAKPNVDLTQTIL